MKTRPGKVSQMHSYRLRSTSAKHEDVNNDLSIQPSAEAQHSVNIPLPDWSSRGESSTSPLETLPLEIIRRIASHASCKAVLALQRVCRVLYHACSDVYIMKHFLDRSSIRSLDASQPSRPAWYDSVLSLEAPLSSWSRYALAHEELEQLITDLEGEVQPRQMRIVSWLPQLLALHYPLQAEHEVDLIKYLFSELHSPSISPSERQVIWFCFAVSEEASCWLAKLSGSSDDEPWGHNQRPDRFWNYNYDSPDPMAQLIVPRFRFILEDLRGGRSLAVPQQLASFPKSDDIPFSTIMDISLPFLDSSVTDFASCHLQTMTTRAFLVGDEWEGCCGYGHGISRLLEPPMRGVVFERYTESVMPGQIQLKARGIDGYGRFTLVGQMDCNDGKVMLCKQRGINGLQYQYSGSITPFGIVGRWYRRSNNSFGGLFWLWKTKWTRESS